MRLRTTSSQTRTATTRKLTALPLENVKRHAIIPGIGKSACDIPSVTITERAPTLQLYGYRTGGGLYFEDHDTLITLPCSSRQMTVRPLTWRYINDAFNAQQAIRE